MSWVDNFSVKEKFIARRQNEELSCEFYKSRGYFILNTLRCKLGELWSSLFLCSTLFGLLLVLSQGSAYSTCIFLVIYTAATINGKIMEFFFASPELGMFLGGVMIQHTNPFEDWLTIVTPTKQEFDAMEKLFWGLMQVSFGVLLVKVGLQVTKSSIKSDIKSNLLLTVVPGCLIEASVVAFVAFVMIDGFTYKMGYLLGFTLASSSPAVVASSVFELRESSKVTPALLDNNNLLTSAIATTLPADFLVSIGGILPILVSSFSIQPHALYCRYWPILALGTFFCSILAGLVCYYLPPVTQSKQNTSTLEVSKSKLFCLAVMLASAILITEAKLMKEATGDIPVGLFGATGVVIFAAIIAQRDQKMTENFRVWINNVWTVLQPLFFGLLGYLTCHVYQEGKKPAEDPYRSPDYLENRSFISTWESIIIIFIAVATRFVTTLLTMNWAQFNWRQKIFIAFSHIPKTPVFGFPFYVIWGMKVREPFYDEVLTSILKVASLSVFVTVPLGLMATRIVAWPMMTRTCASHEKHDIKHEKHKEQEVHKIDI